MSDQTPQPNTTVDGLPVPQAVVNANLPTDTSVDAVGVEPELSDEQIAQALTVAMRDDEGSFQYAPDTAGSPNVAEVQQVQQQQQQAPVPDNTDQPANTWQDVITQAKQTQQQLGQDAGTQTQDAQGEQGAGGAGQGQPFPPGAPQPNVTQPNADQPLPPGYTLAPISEVNPFTGQATTRYYPVPEEDLAGVLGWVNSLAPDERAAVSEFLEARRTGQQLPIPAASGSGPNVPGAPVSNAGVPGAGHIPQHLAAPVPAPTPNTLDLSTLDPDTAQVVGQMFAATQTQLADLARQQQDFQQSQMLFAQQQQQQERVRLQSEITSTTDEFVMSRNLNPDEREVLTQRAAELQVLPTLIQKYAGDTKRAVSEALDMAYWSAPEFRNAAIQAALTEHSQVNQATSERKRKAAAVGGAGAAVPRVAQPSRPLTKSEREQAMAAEIGSAMFNNGQGQ